jgi:hypothetical protein
MLSLTHCQGQLSLPSFPTSLLETVVRLKFPERIIYFFSASPGLSAPSWGPWRMDSQPQRLGQGTQGPRTVLKQVTWTPPGLSLSSLWTGTERSIPWKNGWQSPAYRGCMRHGSCCSAVGFSPGLVPLLLPDFFYRGQMKSRDTCQFPHLNRGKINESYVKHPACYRNLVVWAVITSSFNASLHM